MVWRDIAVRQLTYDQVEADVKRLAARLVAAFSRARLAEFHYVPIPRGGLIVLGMLAYVLDLERARVGTSLEDGAPVVVVDDCSLTGERFSHVLRSLPDREIVFAHLYSPPDLRDAICAKEAHVLACIASQDMRDLARDRFLAADEYVDWQARWRARLPGDRYWIGQPEIVVFPWSEPDHPTWNAATGQVSDDWRLAPPHRCLANWAQLGIPLREEVRPVLRSADGVAFRLQDGGVTLYDQRNGEVFGLHGVAADMWRALAAYGDPTAVVEYLLLRYAVDEATLRADLQAFVDELLAKKLLEASA